MEPLSIKETGSARIAHILECLALIVVLFAALALACTGLFASARISPERYDILQINIFDENELTNVIAVIFAIAAMALIERIPVSRKFNLYFGGAALLLLFVFGALWATSVKAQAESDGDVLTLIAEYIIAGDYAQVTTSGQYLHYYLVRFPYQCGLLTFLEVLVRLFGSTGALGIARLMNVGLLVSSYAALLLITQRLFKNDRITFVTILLLCATLQPLFSCTFVYGLIPAFSLCVWAVYFVLRYLQDGKRWNIAPAAILFAFAALIRSNTWIVIVAVVIVLLLAALRKKAVFPIVFAALIVALAIPMPKLAQIRYETMLDTSFGTGYPKSYWMAMSLQDGWKASGWHVRSYQLMMESSYGEDVEAIDERAKSDIQEKLSELISNPARLEQYFFEKLVSQWDEPTFMSIWITKSVGTYKEPGAITQLVYSDSFDWTYRFFEGKVTKTLYFGFLLFAAASLRKHKPEWMLLPLIILGGILFHLLFEAKSQYVLEYIPLFCPLAAAGAYSFGNSMDKLVFDKIKKRKLAKMQEVAR